MADQDPIIRDGSLYKIVDGPSWQDAQDNAEALGGNLVVINNQNEFENLLKGTLNYNLSI